MGSILNIYLNIIIIYFYNKNILAEETTRAGQQASGPGNLAPDRPSL
jgi:hypothetical protein